MENTPEAMELHKAIVAYKRARTHHFNMQEVGKRDIGVRQTRWMYLAVGTMQRAYHRMKDAAESYARETFGCSARQASMEVTELFND